MINKDTIEEVIKRLVKVYNPIEIYLFGSYAWGNPTEDSDLDLLIVIDKSDEKGYERPVEGYLALFDLGISKDLLIYTQEEFKNATQKEWSLSRKINEKGKRIYARA